MIFLPDIFSIAEPSESRKTAECFASSANAAMPVPFLTMPTPFATSPCPCVEGIPTAATASSPYYCYLLPPPAQARYDAPARAVCTAIKKPNQSMRKSRRKSEKKAEKAVRHSKSNIPGTSRYWTHDEHRLFVLALFKYGYKDFDAISAFVGTRSLSQCRTHEQKCFLRLIRESGRETEIRNKTSATCGHAAGVEANKYAATDSLGHCAAAECDEKDGTVPATGIVGSRNQRKSKNKRKSKKATSVTNPCGMTLLSFVCDEFSRAFFDS